jgi:hypothetical protein
MGMSMILTQTNLLGTGPTGMCVAILVHTDDTYIRYVLWHDMHTGRSVL